MRRSEYRDIENQSTRSARRRHGQRSWERPAALRSATAMPESALQQSAGTSPAGLVRYAARVRSRERWSS